MAKETNEYCDCCGDLVKSDGVPCKGESDTYYKRVKKFEWLLGHWLGWRHETVGWQVVCGNCWDGIGEKVRERKVVVSI